jgi:Tol biopolymer transport system component
MPEWEMVQCMTRQCAGTVYNANGVAKYPVDIAQDYRVVGNYYDPLSEHPWLLSAAKNAHTILHEYAHYLDRGLYPPDPTQPHNGMINTVPFYSFSIDTAGMTSTLPHCITLLSSEQADYITWYAYGSSDAYPADCTNGQVAGASIAEDFAESFSIYIVAGRRFRAAAAVNLTLKRKYEVLRDTVFGGVEYDTDASFGIAWGAQCSARELYVGCDEDFVWSGEMERLPNASITSIGIISVSNTGAQTSAPAQNVLPTISESGRYVAFRSSANTLVPDDTNGVTDIFVHDRMLTTTTRVSVTMTGAQADGGSSNPRISGDGRYVAFVSSATNLVPGDTNGVDDVFLHDRVLGTTTRVSVTTGGVQADGASSDAFLSWNGQVVTFSSYATNLVAGDGNGREDVFVYDAGTTTRVSGDSGGTVSAISADGRFVAYGSDQVYLYDRANGTAVLASVATDGTPALPSTSRWPAVSNDGRYVAFVSSSTNLVPGDTNGVDDLFVRDTVLGQTTRVNLAGDGSQANGSVSPYLPSISGDGRYVAFSSIASNLYANDTNGQSDSFVHDRVTGVTARVATPVPYTSDTGAAGVVVSGDGRVVAFYSGTRIIDADMNAAVDVYAAPNAAFQP